jgi:hypothetical protein
MPYTVTLQNRATGEELACSIDMGWQPHSLYWWSQGNYGCDCNRASVWLGQVKRSLPVTDDGDFCYLICAGDNFALLKIELPDGTAFDDYEELNALHDDKGLRPWQCADQLVEDIGEAKTRELLAVFGLNEDHIAAALVTVP